MTSIVAVICTYQRRDLLLQAIESVKRQTRPPDEIVVAIDGSTDGSADAVRTTFPDVIVVEQENLGRSVAANRAVAASSSTYVAFLDDDDLWHENKLARFEAFLDEHPDARAVNSYFFYFSTSREQHSPYGLVDFSADTLDECHAAAEQVTPRSDMSHLSITGNSYLSLLATNAGALSSSVIHRDAFTAAGGFCPSQACGDDWTLFLNVARLCEWHTLTERLTFVRAHESAHYGDTVAVLATLVNAWLSGRAFPMRTADVDVQSLLAGFGRHYRTLVANAVWSEFRAGNLRRSRRCLQLGHALLPRTRDRLWALVPPPLTLRVQGTSLGLRNRAGRSGSSIGNVRLRKEVE